MARIRFINQDRSNIHFIVVEAMGDCSLSYDEDDLNITQIGPKRWHIVLGQGTDVTFLNTANEIIYSGDIDELVIRDSKGLNVLKEQYQQQFNILNSAGDTLFTFRRR